MNVIANIDVTLIRTNIENILRLKLFGTNHHLEGLLLFMSGEKNLNTLLASMSPVLKEGEYVFVSIQDDQMVNIASLKPLGSFYESEGWSLILHKHLAEQYEIAYSGLFSCITLTVHSSLDAVGLTAAVSSKLTEVNISANVVAAFYHDHIFVPIEDTQQALTSLKELAKDSSGLSQNENEV